MLHPFVVDCVILKAFKTCLLYSSACFVRCALTAHILLCFVFLIITLHYYVPLYHVIDCCILTLPMQSSSSVMKSHCVNTHNYIVDKIVLNLF